MSTRMLAVLAVTLICVGCASGGSKPPTTQEPDPQAQLQPGNDLTTIFPDSRKADYIAEVSAAPVPAGVEAALFEQLRAELIEVLESRQASFTPFGQANGVNDLVINGDGPYYLRWTYRNKGDYDLNGMVNVSDLTPIGVYFGLTRDDPRWLLAKAADGDDNGMITVSDITPIGQYFGGTVLGYQLWGTDDTNGDWTHIGNATIETNLNKNPMNPRFVIQLPNLDYDYYSLWPYDNSDDEGWWSNVGGLGLDRRRYVINMENLWQSVN
ncbi:hypothetical protein JW859_04210 [bacterium]|nr:hypothetical protein [bacterium]